MSHRTFLYVWFPLSWVIAGGATAWITFWLWRPVMVLAEKYGAGLRRFMRVAFPAGIAIPTLAGFLSVSYFQNGCGVLPNSAAVIAHPSQLREVAQKEIAATAESLIYALIVWAAFYTVLLVVWRRNRSSSMAQ